MKFLKSFLPLSYIGCLPECSCSHSFLVKPHFLPASLKNFLSDFIKNTISSNFVSTQFVNKFLKKTNIIERNIYKL